MIADLPTTYKVNATKLRILIVDDSVVARRILMHTLSEEFEIIGYAPSAEMALQRSNSSTQILLSSMFICRA